MEYTEADFSNFLKNVFRMADEARADKFWVNSYKEGRKDATTSVWTLEDTKPTNPKVRYYPAYSKEYFSEHILPKLFFTQPSND